MKPSPGTCVCAPGEATDADRRAWEQWHRHPDHQCLAADRVHSPVRSVCPPIAAPTLQAPAKGRRRALKSILLVASTGSLAYVAYRGASDDGVWRSWVAEYRTGVGERRSVMLTDGSRLTLNTDTAVDVSYAATHRLVHLWTGEILIETARDALYADTQGRPFVVETAHGSMRALGTRFTVRMHGARTDVAVLADAVEIRASDLPASPIILQAGQRVSFTRSRIEAPRPVDETVAAWEYGSLVVDDWRLGDVIAELDRYRPGRLSCDPAVAYPISVHSHHRYR